MFKTRITFAVLCAMLLGLTADFGRQAQAQNFLGDAYYFQETGHTVTGRFLRYWGDNGGYQRQGLPISEAKEEVSPVNGKTYLTQYFERAVFELHPENRPPYVVLLSLLGVRLYQEKYPNGTPPQWANDSPGSILFPETGKRLGSSFLNYWREGGGLPQFGYPLSNEFPEKSPLDGQTYTVQYFQRAVFEYHPEFKGRPYEVLLSHLGRFTYEATHNTSTPELPAPAPGNIQVGPKGSDKYLVWMEGAAGNGSEPFPGTSNILGYDLKARKAIIVTDAPGDQLYPAVSGSFVAWLQGQARGNAGLYAKDLDTGTQYEIMPGKRPDEDFPYYGAPAIDDTSVVFAMTDALGPRLLLKQLDTGVVEEITALRGHNFILHNPEVSEEFVVWSELYFPTVGQSPLNSRIMAYDRKTRTKKVVTEYIYTTNDPDKPLSYSLDGARLVYATKTSQFLFADLRTGSPSGAQFTNLPYNLIMRGNYLLYQTRPEEINGFTLFNSGGGGLLSLVPEAGHKSEVAIAGDWLVWTHKDGANQSHIRIKPLYKAFSEACARISC